MATTGVEQIKTAEEIEAFLINELELMFSRERLEKNNYFIYRMSMNLEIPLQAVYDERSIKSITQDWQLVLKALKKTKNVKVNEEKETFVPIIKPLTNKIILNIQAKEEEGFRKFLEQEKWTNNDFSLVFDRVNSGRIIFNKESDAEVFLQFLKGKKLGEKALEGYVEPENVFITFLNNAQESKKSHTYPEKYGATSTMRAGDPYYPPNMPPYNMYPSYPMMNANPYYYPYYQGYNNPYPYYNPYISSMYIRKAKNEDDYNEEGGVEERQETYQKPHYWAESQKVESEVDNRGKYSSYPPKRGKRGGRFSRGGGYKRFNEGVPSKPAAGNRVRLNSDNFPPLISENDKEKHSHHYDEKEKSEIKIKYKKADIAKIHQELVAKGEIKANSKLSGLKEEEIPFVNIHTSLRKKSENK